MATAREHSPQFACGGLIIYTDVRGEGVKTRLCAAARQPKQGCAVRQMPIKMCGSGYGSELTRRGGGDHMGKDKREGLGSESTNKAPIAPELHKRLLTAAAPYKVSTTRIYRGEGKAGRVVFHALPKASIDLVLLSVSPQFSWRIGSCCECCCWVIDQYLYQADKWGA